MIVVRSKESNPRDDKDGDLCRTKNYILGWVAQIKMV